MKTKNIQVWDSDIGKLLRVHFDCNGAHDSLLIAAEDDYLKVFDFVQGRICTVDVSQVLAKGPRLTIPKF